MRYRYATYLLKLLCVGICLLTSMSHVRAQFAQGCDYDGSAAITINAGQVNGSAGFTTVLVWDDGAGSAGSLTATGLTSNPQNATFTIPAGLSAGVYDFHLFNYYTTDIPGGVNAATYAGILASGMTCYAHSTYSAQVCTDIVNDVQCASECISPAHINIADPGDYAIDPLVAGYAITYVAVNPATGVVLQLSPSGTFTTGTTLPDLNEAASPYEIYAINWNTADATANAVVTGIVPNVTTWASVAAQDNQPVTVPSSLSCLDISVTPYIVCVIGPVVLVDQDTMLCEDVVGSLVSASFDLTQTEAAIGGVGGTWDLGGTTISTPSAVFVDASTSNPVIYNYTYTDPASGCPSTATLTIQILSGNTITNPQTICNGDNYTLNGNVYTAAGSYFDTLQNALGCDSIVETMLTVIDIPNTSNPQSICDGDVYSINGNSYSISGTYHDTLVSYQGCDSVIETILNVIPPITTANPQTICAGDTYTINGNTYNAAGTYNDTLVAWSGCDSVIVTDITVIVIANTLNPQMICEGDNYVFNGNTYNLAGTYYDTLVSYQGCDSVIETALQIIATVTYNNPQSICTGGSYMINGNTYSTAGTYNDTFTTASGCDSVVVTVLTIDPIITYNNPQSICTGGSYTINGNTYSTAGTYNDTFTTASGCDSVVTTVLTIDPTITYNNPQSICTGGSYTINGNTYSVAGTYSDTFTTASGCDSVVTTVLTIDPIITYNNPQSICTGGSYTINGNTYTVAGVYNDTFTTASGCDSVVTTILTIDPIITYNNPQSICNGSTYTINGNTYTVAGTYNDTFTTASGCDSLVITVLTEVTAFTSNNPQTICEGSSYSINGNTYSAEGFYNDTLTSMNGCDSIIVTEIIFSAPIVYNNLQSICLGSSYSINGNTYTTAGTYNDTLTTASGCDSIVITDLNIVTSITTNNPQSICNGDTYSINGNVYAVAGTYVDTFISAGGCDSIVTTILSISPSYAINNPQVICTGNTYTINGNTYSVTGIYTDILFTIDGCDSIITTDLQVLNEITAFNPQSICAGSSYTINGNTYTNNGIYLDTLISSGGCDSIVTTDITIVTEIIAPNPQTICAGSTYTINGNSYNTTGIYNDTLIASGGCDSIIVTDLTVLDPTTPTATNLSICAGNTATLSASGCAGGTVQWYDAPVGGTLLASGSNFTTPVLTSSTLYYMECVIGTCTSTRGMVSVTVTPIPTLTITGLNATYCMLDSDVTLTASPAGGVFTVDGVLSTSFSPSTLGPGLHSINYSISAPCPTNTLQTVLVYAAPDAQLSTADSILCVGDSPITLTGSPAGGVYSGIGVAGSTFDPSVGVGTYTAYYNIAGASALCSDIDSMQIIVAPRPIPALTIGDICAGQEATLYYTGDSNVVSLSWDFQDASYASTESGVGPIQLIYDQGGIHTISVEVENSYGCTATATENVNVTEYNVQVMNDATIQYGESILLNTSINPYANNDLIDVQWIPSSSLSCDTCEIPYATPLTDMTYIITVTDTNGCIARDTVTIYVDIIKEVYIPSAFTPNADDMNDFFQVYGINIDKVLLRVYNRWGEKVFESDDERIGWDGAFKGRELNPAVFAYVAEVTFIDGKSRTYKGNVTLVR